MAISMLPTGFIVVRNAPVCCIYVLYIELLTIVYCLHFYIGFARMSTSYHEIFGLHFVLFPILIQGCGNNFTYDMMKSSSLDFLLNQDHSSYCCVFVSNMLGTFEDNVMGIRLHDVQSS